jgi:hypothetical protein
VKNEKPNVITKSPFLLLFGNPETRDHLKEEMRARFSQAKFSYTCERMTTFKRAEGEWDLYRLPEVFTAENVALFVGKAKQGDESDALAASLAQEAIPEGFQLFSLPVRNEMWWGLQSADRSQPLMTEKEYPIELTDGSKLPSRSYYKLLEMCEAAGIELAENDRVLEIGCAPGGMSTYALEMGCEVLGVDRGLVAQSVRHHPHFRQLSMSIADVPDEDLPVGIHWLVIDMHAEPRVLVQQCEFLFRRVTRGMFLTLKLNHIDTVRQLPKIHEALKRILPWKWTTLRQLPSHHQEVCFIGIL